MLLLAFSAQADFKESPMQIEGATTVDAKGLIKLIESKPNLVLFDNRKLADFNAGHIEGAVNLLDTDITEEAVLAKHAPTKDIPILFHCNGGKCVRGANAAVKAIKWGYKNVYYYPLGIDDWKQQGLPLISK